MFTYVAFFSLDNTVKQVLLSSSSPSVDEKTEGPERGSAGSHMPLLREQPRGDGRQVEEEAVVALL